MRRMGVVSSIKFVLNTLPIVAIFLLLGWSFKEFILFYCVYLLSKGYQVSGFMYIIVYHILVLLFLVSYLRTALTTPLPVPDGEKFCSKCTKSTIFLLKIKGTKSRPIRTHHCSWCRKCIVKFDHHCPWYALRMINSNFQDWKLCGSP
jgi:hypothetical protein